MAMCHHYFVTWLKMLLTYLWYSGSSSTFLHGIYAHEMSFGSVWNRQVVLFLHCYITALLTFGRPFSVVTAAGVSTIYGYCVPQTNVRKSSE
jgi:hypothetical protein